MTNKPRILFTTPILRHPAVGGPFLRIENSIKAISQISKLTIYCRTPLTQSEIEYYQSFCENFYCIPPMGLFKYHVNQIKIITNFFANKVLKQEIFREKTDYKDFLRFADTIHPDIIWPPKSLRKFFCQTTFPVAVARQARSPSVPTT